MNSTFRQMSFSDALRPDSIPAAALGRDGRRNVLFCASNYTQSAFYRCYLPAISLQWHSTRYNALFARHYRQELMDWADVVVWQMQSEPALTDVYQQLRDRGAKQVYEIDDLIHRLEELNPCHKFMEQDPQKYRRMWLFMNMCDGMIVSTKPLAEYYEPSLNKQRRVIGNAVNVAGIDILPSRGVFDHVRLVWAGGTSHIADMALLRDPLTTIKRAYGDRVKIITMGFDGTMQHDGKWITAGVPADFHHAGAPLDRFHGALRKLTPHIGLAPLVDSPFNRAKSNLKWLDYTMAGGAVLASAVAPYTDTVAAHAPAAVMELAENTPDAWEQQLASLIENGELREHLAEQALAVVRREYSVESRCALYEQYFDELIESGASPCRTP